MVLARIASACPCYSSASTLMIEAWKGRLAVRDPSNPGGALQELAELGTFKGEQ
jgi:hypothetical protein